MEKIVLNQLCEDYQKKYGHEFIIHKTQSVGGGCISHGMRLSTSVGEFFLKWNLHVASDLFTREAECLNEMASVPNEFLKVPRALLASHVNDTPGYLLMEYLVPGNVANEDELLGRGLAVLHQKKSDQFGFHHNNYCGSTLQPNQWTTDWLGFFGQSRILYLVNEINKSRDLTASELNTYHRLVEKLPDRLGGDHEPSLIHGDLWSGNYKYTSSGPAIFDPASYYADREMELSMMSMFGGFSQRTWQAYLEAFPLNPGWQERIQLYQLYHVLNHYYLFGGSYGNQAFSIAKKFL